jgi:predicted nucleic acid-binding protein
LILVDTSVWVDHLRSGDAQLADLLERGAVLMHPFVVGEIACGSLSDRPSILELLQDLPAALVAEGHEILTFIERHVLHGKEGATLWTRDKRLRIAAEELGCAFRDSDSH